MDPDQSPLPQAPHQETEPVVDPKQSSKRRYISYAALAVLILIAGVYSLLRFTWIFPSAHTYLSSFAAERNYTPSIASRARTEEQVFNLWKIRTQSTRTLKEYLAIAKQFPEIEIVNNKTNNSETLCLYIKSSKKHIFCGVGSAEEGAFTAEKSPQLVYTESMDSRVGESSAKTGAIKATTIRDKATGKVVFMDTVNDYSVCMTDDGLCAIFSADFGDLVGITQDYKLNNLINEESCGQLSSEASSKLCTDYLIEGSKKGASQLDSGPFPKVRDDSQNAFITIQVRPASEAPVTGALGYAEPNVTYNSDGAIVKQECTVSIYVENINVDIDAFKSINIDLNKDIFVRNIIKHELMHCFGFGHTTDIQYDPLMFDVSTILNDIDKLKKLGIIRGTTELSPAKGTLNIEKQIRKKNEVVVDIQKCSIGCDASSLRQVVTNQPDGLTIKITCECKEGYEKIPGMLECSPKTDINNSSGGTAPAGGSGGSSSGSPQEYKGGQTGNAWAPAGSVGDNNQVGNFKTCTEATQDGVKGIICDGKFYPNPE